MRTVHRFLASLVGVFYLTSRLGALSASLCRILTHLYPTSEHALRGHLLANITVSPRGSCGSYCFDTPECFSYNVGPGPDELEFTCELSDSDAAQHPDDLVPRPGFTYQGYENACLTSAPCSSHRACRIGYEDPFRCTCQRNYTGLSCELPKNVKVDVLSAGLDGKGGLNCNLKVDGTEYCLKSRGHNLAAFSLNGTLIAKAVFDTYGDTTAGSRMSAFIDSLPSNSLVLVAVTDSGERHISDASEALKSIGAVEPLTLSYRASWFLIGYKGEPRPSWVKQGFAQQHQGPSKGTAVFPREGCLPHGNQIEKWCSSP
ncbi:uncharacterized protein LOC5509010 [Nematostella vectensis]|uniref:uncharacterized protein LOC5509010 n=1 Tax=Nematostella vectensis TaxID=45351 RepID=UPI0020773F11|nr:uncharacterized protein LOC5509010 [Nematostella vectensis]